MIFGVFGVAIRLRAGVSKVISPGIKRMRREFSHSSLSNGDVKNEWSYTSAVPIRLYSVIRKEFS